MYRKDHKFLLDSVIPRRGQSAADYDLVIASQPWRARMDADSSRRSIVLAPLARGPSRAGGRLLAVQSFGREMTSGSRSCNRSGRTKIRFQVNRHELLKALKDAARSNEARDYNFNAYADSKAVFQYKMHTLA